MIKHLNGAAQCLKKRGSLKRSVFDNLIVMFDIFQRKVGKEKGLSIIQDLVFLSVIITS